MSTTKSEENISPPNQASDGCVQCDCDKRKSHFSEATQGHSIHAALHWIDPASLVETSGQITKYLMNVEGDIDGFLLDGVQQVHFAPHMSSELVKAVNIGEVVKVRGLKPRGVDLLFAASVVNDHGKAVINHGQKKKH